MGCELIIFHDRELIYLRYCFFVFFLVTPEEQSDMLQSTDSTDEDDGGSTSTTTSSLKWGLAALAIAGGLTVGLMAVDRHMQNNRGRHD